MALKKISALEYLRNTSRIERNLTTNTLKSKDEVIEHLENAIALDKAIVVLMKLK